MQAINLFNEKSGNALIVAMDHGLLGVQEGFERPKQTLKQVLEGSPDGIMITPNFARHFHDDILSRPSKLKIIIRVDFVATSTLPGVTANLEIQTPFSNVEEAKELGADAVATFLIFGREDPSIFLRNIAYLGILSKETHKYDIPLVIETVLWGNKIIASGKETDAHLLKHACRIAFELGADIIKMPYPGDREEFSEIVESCPVPIMILGGPKTRLTEGMFRTVKDAMSSGAKGIFFGRNIWQRKNPASIIQALKYIIHEGGSVEDAIKIMDRTKEA